MKNLLAIAFILTLSALAANAQRVKINFTPESETFAAATTEYRAIWKSEGDKIVKALEKVSGLKFRETEFETIVFEGISRSGRPGGSPMKMRASYSADTKKATLIHEIGHRQRYGAISRKAFEVYSRPDKLIEVFEEFDALRL